MNPAIETETSFGTLHINETDQVTRAQKAFLVKGRLCGRGISPIPRSDIGSSVADLKAMLVRYQLQLYTGDRYADHSRSACVHVAEECDGTRFGHAEAGDR